MDGASVPGRWATREERGRARQFRESLGDLAQTLAEGLTSNLEVIYMLERWSGRTTLWAAWEIKREAGATGMRIICTKVRDRNEE